MSVAKRPTKAQAAQVAARTAAIEALPAVAPCGCETCSAMGLVEELRKAAEMDGSIIRAQASQLFRIRAELAEVQEALFLSDTQLLEARKQRDKALGAEFVTRLDVIIALREERDDARAEANQLRARLQAERVAFAAAEGRVCTENEQLRAQLRTEHAGFASHTWPDAAPPPAEHRG